MAAKRSPILGYNHNVRYRGLVFHVQTEDSGVMSPHLFTHMFHGGVIVSTRKLVYDSGSAEDAIKSLMQAQHKAVLKDLKRGQFDDKIDQYLGGTQGLLPRGAVDDERASQAIEPITDLDSAPIGAPLRADTAPEPAPEPAPVAPPLEPPPPMDDLPTHLDTAGSMAAAIAAANAASAAAAAAAAASAAEVSVPRTNTDSAPEIEIQLEVDDDRDDEPVPAVAAAPSVAAAIARAPGRDSSAPHRRSTRDTEVKPFEPTAAEPAPVAISATASGAISDGIPRPSPNLASGRSTLPGILPPEHGDARTRTPQESVPPLPPAPDKRIGASSLPPMRPTTRPPSRPAMVAPTVVSRPLTNDDSRRAHRDSDAIEVYAPPPSSAQDPPGVMTERPGQYSLRRSQKIDVPVPVEPPKPRDRSGAAAIPSGLARPGRSGPIRTITAPPGSAVPPPTPVAAPASASGRPDVPLFSTSQSMPTARPRPTAPPVAEPPPPPVRPVSAPIPVARPPSGPMAATQPRGSTVPMDPRARTATPAQYERPRTPTPARVVPPTSRTTSASGSGVVMTRPAVIVGAPAKPPASRVRKASEESRGFGQGLISEKSLDEVILAYLSEDAEDK